MKRQALGLALALLCAGCAAKNDPVAFGPGSAAGKDQTTSPAGGAPKNDPATSQPGSTGGGTKDAPASKSKRIADGQAQTYKGLRFDIPKNWRANAQDESLVLLPEGANPTGQVEELYLLASKADVHTLDGAAADQTVEQVVAQIQKGMQRQGAIEKTTSP